MIRDGFVNFVNGLGTTKDPRSSTRYALTPMTADQLLTAYRSNWLARRVVDALAEDATREWRDWQASDPQIQKIEDEEKRHDIQAKTRQGLVKSRLFGGAGIVMGINGTGSVSEELDLDRVKQGALKYVVVLSSNEMTRGELITDLDSPWFGRPRYYRINNAGTVDATSAGLMMVDIHPSRVVELVGASIPDWSLQNSVNGWGDSVLQSVDEALKDYGTTISSIAAMVNDCKVDVFTIPGLTKSFANPDYENLLTARLVASNTMKSTINAMVKDKDEEWDRVQSQFAGLPDVMSEMLKVVAGAAGIPMTRLVGHGSGSGSSTLGGGKSGGESDLRNYYDSVASRQRNEYGPALAPLDEVVLRSATGARDEKIYYDWAPLYQPDPAELVDIAVKKSQVMTADVTAGLINPDVLRKARLNSLVEDNFYPGLEAAIDEFGEEPEEPTQEDVANHLKMLQSSSKQLQSIAGPAQKLLPAPRTQDALFYDYEDNTPLHRRAPYFDPAMITSSGRRIVRSFSWDYDPEQPRDRDGKWTSGGGDGAGQESDSSDLAQKLLALHHSGEETMDDVWSRITPKERNAVEIAERAFQDAGGVPTSVQFTGPDGKYTPEREALHNRILAEMFTKERVVAARPAPGQPPTLTLTGGRPASGKTSTLKNELADVSKNSFYISADEIQEKLPGYNGTVAGLYNGEAQDIALRAEKVARAARLNITYDATLKSTKPAIDRVYDYKRDGYRVNGYFAHTSPVTSAVRSVKRFMATGRYIPPSVSFNSRTNEKTFDTLRPLLDKWAIYDNNGDKSRLVARGGS